jgi:hypothetical protein
MRLSVPAIAHTARNRLRDSSAAFFSSVLLAASCMPRLPFTRRIAAHGALWRL